ncbi:MAG: CopG family transcriptional regulator [Actinobacteria bacterium]|nr:CopG family transcriptional regulator [Actinomycetota bacterium]
MPKEKVTLTLDADAVHALRQLVGARSLSAAVDDAVRAHLAKLQHLAAVDEWLVELEREHGPVPPETLEWAAQIVDRWTSETHSDAVIPNRRAS